MIRSLWNYVQRWLKSLLLRVNLCKPKSNNKTTQTETKYELKTCVWSSALKFSAQCQILKLQIQVQIWGAVSVRQCGNFYIHKLWFHMQFCLTVKQVINNLSFQKLKNLMAFIWGRTRHWPCDYNAHKCVPSWHSLPVSSLLSLTNKAKKMPERNLIMSRGGQVLFCVTGWCSTDIQYISSCGMFTDNMVENSYCGIWNLFKLGPKKWVVYLSRIVSAHTHTHFCPIIFNSNTQIRLGKLWLIAKH